MPQLRVAETGKRGHPLSFSVARSLINRMGKVEVSLIRQLRVSIRTEDKRLQGQALQTFACTSPFQLTQITIQSSAIFQVFRPLLRQYTPESSIFRVQALSLTRELAFAETSLLPFRFTFCRVIPASARSNELHIPPLPFCFLFNGSVRSRVPLRRFLSSGNPPVHP